MTSLKQLDTVILNLNTEELAAMMTDMVVKVEVTTIIITAEMPGSMPKT